MKNTLQTLRLPALALTLLLAACQKEAIVPTPGPVTPSVPLPEHLTMGNPSGATTDPAQPTNYLLLKSQYALNYHRDRGILN